MKKLKSVVLVLLLSVCSFFMACDKNGDFLLFSVNDDIALGEMMAKQISEDPSFDILSRENYGFAYDYIESMLDNILASEEITYREEFPWTINIINDDQVLNAFATPGGQLYVYTGLIYFFNEEDALAGVLAHEVAHSDQRHGSKNLQRQYGISILLSIIAGGDASALEQAVAQIAGTGAILAFSRDAEAEADNFSVRYLSGTSYACNGAAIFFEKLLANQQQRDPEFLSTHPSPDSRVTDINATAGEINCDTTIDDDSAVRYLNFRNSLP